MSPHGPSDTASAYAAVSALSVLFGEHPTLRFHSLTIHENGHIDVLADGARGVKHDWAHALPAHTTRSGLVATFYGSEETDVLMAGHITVTIRHPLVGPGGAS